MLETVRNDKPSPHWRSFCACRMARLGGASANFQTEGTSVSQPPHEQEPETRPETGGSRLRPSPDRTEAPGGRVPRDRSSIIIGDTGGGFHPQVSN